MSVRLTLICHASTVAVRAAAFPMDEPLDPQGEAKAAAAARTVRRVDAAWCSPALRARQTAAALGLAAAIEPALADIDLGRWAGRPLEVVQAADPSGFAQWGSDALARPHGGETVADLLARVRVWLDTVAARTGRIVAVTHPAVVRAAIVVVLEARPLSFWRIDVAPLGQVEFHARTGTWTLRSLGLGRD